MEVAHRAVFAEVTVGEEKPMDPLQSSSVEGHPPVETAGSTSAVGAEGYATVMRQYFMRWSVFSPYVTDSLPRGVLVMGVRESSVSEPLRSSKRSHETSSLVLDCTRPVESCHKT